VIAEEATHFAELFLGRYLNAYNLERKSWGTTWEAEARARQAAERVTQSATEGSRVRQEIEGANSFTALLDLLQESDNLAVTPSKFVGLYLALPKSERDSVIASKELLDLYYTSDWKRTGVKSADNGAIAYLIDSQNQVIKSVSLPDRLVRVAGETGKILRGGLESLPVFTGRIYPAERFFALLFNLTEVERSQLFPDPGLLLSLPKPVSYVGFAPAERGESFAVIGFQSDGASGAAVTTYPITKTAFERLTFLFAMEGSDTLFTPSPDGEEDSQTRDEMRTNRKGEAL